MTAKRILGMMGFDRCLNRQPQAEQEDILLQHQRTLDQTEQETVAQSIQILTDTIRRTRRNHAIGWGITSVVSWATFGLSVGGLTNAIYTVKANYAPCSEKYPIYCPSDWVPYTLENKRRCWCTDYPTMPQPCRDILSKETCAGGEEALEITGGVVGFGAGAYALAKAIWHARSKSVVTLAALEKNPTDYQIVREAAEKLLEMFPEDFKKQNLNQLLAQFQEQQRSLQPIAASSPAAQGTFSGSVVVPVAEEAKQPQPEARTATPV